MRTLLTTAEVAGRLGLSREAVAQAVRAGALEPTARTSDDLLFTERAVAAFAAGRAEATSSAPQPLAPGTLAERSGELEHLNSWLEDLTEAAPADPSSPAAGELTPVVDREAIDLQRPPVAPSQPSLLERIEASQPIAPDASAPPVEANLGPSRQALLVVRPVGRYRVLRDVAGRLASLPDIAEARLERLEEGVAFYRVSFEGDRPSVDAVGSALADLHLEVLLVDSFT